MCVVFVCVAQQYSELKTVGHYFRLISVVIRRRSLAVVLPGGERVRTGAPPPVVDCYRPRDRERSAGEKNSMQWPLRASSRRTTTGNHVSMFVNLKFEFVRTWIARSVCRQNDKRFLHVQYYGSNTHSATCRSGWSILLFPLSRSGPPDSPCLSRVHFWTLFFN